MRVRESGIPRRGLCEQLFDVEVILDRHYGLVLTHSNDAERRP